MDWVDNMLLWFAITFTYIAGVVFLVDITSIVIGWALLGALISMGVLIARSL